METLVSGTDSATMPSESAAAATLLSASPFFPFLSASPPPLPRFRRFS